MKAGVCQRQKHFIPNQIGRDKAVNQNQWRRLFIASFLKMDPDTIDRREPRILRVIDQVDALRPTDIAWAGQKLSGHGPGDDPLDSRQQITFLHDGWNLNPQGSLDERGCVLAALPSHVRKACGLPI